MRFDRPECLWLLLPAAWWLWSRYRRQQAAINYSSLGLLLDSAVSWRTRWAPFPEILRALAVVVLVMALARPQWRMEEHSRFREAVAIELLVDVSSSMDMQLQRDHDSQPRLTIVKEVLERFVLGDDKTLQGRQDDLIGLVTFARYADTVSPLTEAHDALVDLIRDLTIENRPNEDGTGYGDAVALAAARLHHLDNTGNRDDPRARIKSRVIVLLTDGENNCGRHLPLEATALAKQWGIRIYVISLADQSFSADPRHASQSTPSTAVQILERMAGETGGIYRTVGDLKSLEAFYEEIDALEKSRISIRTSTAWNELFPYFTASALLLVMLEMILRSTLLRRIP